MKSLIIHVGPPKCGSTSIQRFFGMHENPCIEKTKFVPLTGKILEVLSQDEVENSDFINLFEGSLKESDCLIVSHEALFHSPKALENICMVASKRVTEITIVGYSRKVAGFIISRYNQWGFRRTENDKDIERILLENELDPVQFMGVEKEIIWHILTDFSEIQIANWYHSYGEIEKVVSPYDVEVRAGILQNKESNESLIENFCKTANLSIREDRKDEKIRSNIQFSSHLTESIKIAGEMGLNVPTPHTDNEFFREFSKIIDSEMVVNYEFLSILREYVDSCFYESNLKFCRKYNLNQSYFAASEQYSRNEILEIIKAEQRKRIEDQTLTKRYRELSGILAAACFKYYKAQPAQNEKGTINESGLSDKLAKQSSRYKNALKRIFG